jgi:hypothetical protein
MIYCPQCGTPNADTASVCGNCQTALPQASAQIAPTPGAGMPPPESRPQIQNYLVPAILVTLCCCLPGGIVAIVYAAQVNSKLQAGDIAGAQAASNNAKLWCMIAAGSGIVINILIIALNMLGVLASLN